MIIFFMIRKRTGFYGSYLLACYNEDMEVFETVTMLGGGIKDSELEKFYNLTSPYIIEKPRKDYKVGNVTVDVWFDAKLVWEVKSADLSISPVYAAANDLTEENGKGISLRFPRFIRERVDKQVTEATTSEEIYSMFKNQSYIRNNNKIDFEEDDFYD